MNPVITYFFRTLALFRKELLALVKDPSSRVLLFAPALLQALLFGYGATYDLTHVPYAVLDHSRGATATQLLARLDGTGVFERVATLTSSDQIAGVIDKGDALLVVSIPSDFEARLAANQQAPLQVILDGRNSSTAGAAAAYVSSIVTSYNQTLGNRSSITIVRRSWFNPNLESRWNMMPALIASLSMIQTLMLAALSVAREREQGTFDQLLVTPLTPLQILIGKALPSIFIGLIQSTIIFLIILFWFQIPMNGSVWLLYFGLFCFTVASVGIGLSISAVSLTMQQAMLYTFMLVMPLMLLSGLLTPVRNMPAILQVATYVNPLRFGIDIVRRVYLEGATFGDIASNFLPLLAVAAVTLPLAAWLFRNRLG
ncbi:MULTISPECIES: ABC transporter permease [Hyphomicrobiales]|uniref:ABC transporter permease n=1 Tax=Hyphomicrobiales TaxID=356 RepID=UPI000C3FC227|nr:MULTISPECIES: ABC transporter permease [Hyphomicrobiales]MAA99230.1 antibiotic ABC transporter permease [Stappia sp.]MAM93397.1 antibiotic ABC transporter permease [Parvibaculum sp.]MBM19467.1 antibiotic ABC transporter permease [Stappia sp.]NIJ42832.1 ABC-2 type transport system permease protein [Parvibaculum indicum]|tara:strand:+ start:15225 stop:16337 length:1113 start_codon:yes stop_codon:yes gene_type:complete